jgi:hypothetical protein
MERRNAQITISTIVSLGMLGVLGCLGGQGSTDGGSGADGNFRGDVFVSDDISTGTVELEIQNPSLGIGETSPFTVRVLNARRQPVKQINVVCDSEQGIAILEPQTGYEMTNSSGIMSGVIGCASPGSFQMVCRLSVGANKREFGAVQCSGDVPPGFQGFPGAAGGGLGGGSPTDGSDSGVRITSISFFDGPDQGSSTPSIDIDFDPLLDCDPSTEGIQNEIFTDTIVSLNVQNDGTQAVRFTGLRYKFEDYKPGADFTSRLLGITYEGGANIQVGESAVFSLPVFKAYGGVDSDKWVGDPEGPGEGFQITNDGIRTVTFTLIGETVLGDSVEITGATSAAFGDYRGCPSS